MIFRSLCLAAACALFLAPAHGADLPPAVQFFENPAFGDAVLSPDARSLAVRVAGKGSRERLAVLDIASNTAKVVAEFEDVDVRHVEWISDNRLVFTTFDWRWTPGDKRHAPGLYAVDKDGKRFLQLITRTAVVGTDGRPLLPWFAHKLDQPGKQDSEFIYVELPQYKGYPNIDYVDLLKVNTLTGKATPVKRPEGTTNWMLDHNGEPRLAVSVQRDEARIAHRDPDGSWRTIGTGKVFAHNNPQPLGFGPDGTLYARALKDGDKMALYTVDLTNAKLSAKPVLSLDGYDFSGRLITGNNTLLGVTYDGEAAGTHWLDPSMAAVQKAVDALLPDTVNQITVAARPHAPVVLVASFSDRKPVSYRLFNHQSGELNKVGESHPKIQPSQMGSQATVRYKARDGLEIPAYLTLPAGSNGKNLPLVVLVHGGPFVRGGHWGWNGQSQFLASRGYAVLEPDFRGSAGYGAAHHKAGWKQWGLAMQDDLADGAKWAIAQGIADGKRICLVGGSYGGYATAMGLIKDPELFKCGVAFAAVTDLNLLYDGHWSFESDMRDIYKNYGFKQYVGDPVADAEQFKATSPLKQAARLKQPLLLVHGTDDARVPLYHFNQFRDALKAANAPLETIEYKGEGHGLSLIENRVDFWTRTEQFLDRHIGPAASAK
jgi:dipeptidyl aminopeptidase/acylaminoacyl peptidase